MTGMAVGATTCFYVMDYENGWMFEFARQIFNTPNAPLVVSMSYAWVEAEQCITVQNVDEVPFLSNCSALHIPNSQVYVNRTNVEFIKLGLMGHTLLAASGDDGTAGTHSSYLNCTGLGPLYPASSPYVLSVGGTSIEASNSTAQRRQTVPGQSLPPICTDWDTYQCNCTTSTNEQIALATNTAGFDTGGGFANFQPMPSYQVAAVNSYLTSGVALPDASLFNATNRAYPDIAACAENVCVLSYGAGCEGVGGTSAATPMMGAMITLLNQDRLNAKKTPIGFFTPLVYKMYALNAGLYFNDKLGEGNNGGECGYALGFNSITGWDPLTGVGSPQFANIRKYVATLP